MRPAPAPPLSATDVERRERIDAALSAWRGQLVDLGGVASLDDITMLDGVVDLTAAHPSGLAQLYAGRPTNLSSIVRERNALGEARQSLREVSARTDVLARQFGVAPVYLAIGVATWNETIPEDGEEDSLHLVDGVSPEADLTAQIPHVERIAAEHAARNALAAAGLALAAGLAPELIAERLGSVSIESPHRMDVSELGGDLLLIDDSYNANIDSMTAALAVLPAWPGTGVASSWFPRCSSWGSPRLPITRAPES